MPRLRCKQSELQKLARRYTYDTFDISSYVPKIKSQGFLSKDDLRLVARWKAPRSAGHVEKNAEQYVIEITSTALSATGERARIEILTLLSGVGWPTASVILHFFHREPYPIIDFRALWTLSLEVPTQYSFDYWWRYVSFCRRLAGKARLTMRELDKALWQYSKENQKPV